MDDTLHILQETAEEEIISKIVKGETALFEILIRRNNSCLYKVARSYGFNHHDAQDMMQEAYLTAYVQLPRFEFRASFKTWITKILIHKCLYKKTYGYYKREEPDTDSINANAKPMHIVNSTSPEAAMMRKEFTKVIEHHLQLLPVIYKTVFILREVEGFKVEETAELLGISAVNVKVRLNRAKALLQKRLEKYYSAADVFEFNLIYCDTMVKNVLDKINKLKKDL
ncbi:MAG: sigma-70 family RNA polymerase sigma factor [Flavisolibacter sp.]